MEAKRNTKSIGDLSEAAILAILVQKGYAVAVPFGENHRYDLIVEIDGGLKRIQVKTGRYRGGAVLFNCCSTHGHRGRPNRPYSGEIDFFAVYCPDLGSAYLVPIEHAKAVTFGSLRVVAPANGQRRGIQWAASFEIAPPGAFAVGARPAVGVPAQTSQLPL